MECSDGSGDFVEGLQTAREDGVMGSLAARRVAEGDWAGVLVSRHRSIYFQVSTARWNSSIPSASLAVGADAAAKSDLLVATPFMRPLSI